MEATAAKGGTQSILMESQYFAFSCRLFSLLDGNCFLFALEAAHSLALLTVSCCDVIIEGYSAGIGDDEHRRRGSRTKTQSKISPEPRVPTLLILSMLGSTC